MYFVDQTRRERVFLCPCHTSNCRCVGGVYSPESLTHVSSSGFAQLPPACNSNYLGEKPDTQFFVASASTKAYSSAISS
ncbi:hypothetical protein C5Y41_10200 [Rahnella variigena]|nr:hypothetical protein C5Y41_10200 [Rahnella variigena]